MKTVLLAQDSSILFLYFIYKGKKQLYVKRFFFPHNCLFFEFVVTSFCIQQNNTASIGNCLNYLKKAVVVL